MIRISLLVGVSALAISGAAAAQTTAPRTAPGATAPDDQTAVLDDIVVTTQRREQRLQDVPATVTALSSEQLAKSGVTNVFDLQTVVSGLSYGGAGNSTQPSIRGVSTAVSTSGAENPNALYVDGVYYSQPQLFGANLPDVARIEVLKGPQGTLFGRNSVGGAIRIFTKDPTFEPSGDFTAEVSTYTGGNGSRSAPRYAARGFVSVPLIQDRLAASLSAGYDHTDGWMTNDVTGDRYGVVTRANARAKLLFIPNDDTRVLLSAYYLDHDDRGLQSMTTLNGLVAASAYPGSVIPTTPYHTAFDTGLGGSYDRADVKSYGFSANAAFTLGEWGTLTSTTAVNKDQVRNFTTLTHSSDATACLVAFACVNLVYPFDNKAFTQELNFSSEQFGKFRYTAGLFYFDQTSTLDTLANASIVPGGVPNNTVRYEVKSYAAYGQVEFSATERLTIALGGRYTREDRSDEIFRPVSRQRDQTFKSFLPRLSVVYDVTDDWNLYATYALGEKSGLTGIANTGTTPQFKEVAPEENTAHEIGAKFFRAGTSINLSAFYYDYKDKQEQIYSGTQVTLQNTGPVRIYGFDADTTFRLSDAFTVRANASWVPVAEYRDFPGAVGYSPLVRNPNGSFRAVNFDATGMRLIRSPKVTANVSLGYDRSLDRGDVDASVTVAYSSSVSQDTLQFLKQPAYATVGALAGYTFRDSGVRIGVYGRNLTNEAYLSHAFASGVGFTLAYSRPREVGLSLSYAY